MGMLFRARSVVDTSFEEVKIEGKLEGKPEGMPEGKLEGKLEVARQMKIKGTASELISELTSLPIPDIERL
jgi:predicted transposase YdaD